MKHLKRLFALLILVFVLANGASAGQGVIYPWITPPPPSTYGGAARSGSTDPGEELKSEDATVDLVTEITLSLVRNLLALL
ncbi:MAG: hypothetical protein LC803_14475 [Acidobacteria bacterium]|nr:hypothetical protein [Acidobacteriota bacterium]